MMLNNRILKTEGKYKQEDIDYLNTKQREREMVKAKLGI
jgi:hypothetical protein